MSGDESVTRRAVGALFDAIESRDLRRLAAALSPQCSWQNVPHAPALGRDAVVAMFEDVVHSSDLVRWTIREALYDGNTAWIERSDRFVVDGVEHSVHCNGVFVVDPVDALVSEVRDYVDLGEWRSRIGAVLQHQRERPALDVVGRHLAAVDRRDPIAMAADYAADAVLVRDGERHDGWAAIADYFDTVPPRLEGRALAFDEVTETEPGRVLVTWVMSSLAAPNETIAGGADDYLVVDGRIVQQVVTLATPDF